jgi:hypothetical protein
MGTEQDLDQVTWQIIWDEPDLYATLVNDSTGEIVYLLFIPYGRQRTVVQMSNAEERLLKIGSEYDTRIEIESAERDLIRNGYKKRDPGFTFDTLNSTITLATRLGYRFVNLPTEAAPPGFRKTPLADWHAVHGDGGENWEYAYDFPKIVARPKLRPNFPAGGKMSGAQFVGSMQAALRDQRAVGQEQSFQLSK